jgi:hypothetical protein
MEYEGGNGTISVEGDQLTLTHWGPAAEADGLAIDQPRRIPLQAISEVKLEKAGWSEFGWLTLGLGGHGAPDLTEKSAASNAETVTFLLDGNETFLPLYEWLLTVIEFNQSQGIDPSSVEFDAAPTPAEQEAGKAPKLADEEEGHEG